MESGLVVTDIVGGPEVAVRVLVEGHERGVGVLRRALLDGPGVVGSDLRRAIGVWVLVLPEGEEACRVC